MCVTELNMFYFKIIFECDKKKKEFTSILFSWYFMCWAEWNIEIIYSFFIYPLNEHLVNGAPEKQVTKICFHVWKGRKKWSEVKSFHVSKIFFPCVKTSISSKWTFLGNFALKFSQEILFYIFLSNFDENFFFSNFLEKIAADFHVLSEWTFFFYIYLFFCVCKNHMVIL